MELTNGQDANGRPTLTVTPEDAAPYEIDVLMMFCLFGILSGLNTFRAGTCARLKVRGLVDGLGDNWSLTEDGHTVFAACRPALSEFMETFDAG